MANELNFKKEFHENFDNYPKCVVVKSGNVLIFFFEGVIFCFKRLILTLYWDDIDVVLIDTRPASRLNAIIKRVFFANLGFF